MSALMTPRRAKRGRRTGRPAGASGQSALFGAGSAPVVAPAPRAAAVEAPAVPAVEAPEALAIAAVEAPEAAAVAVPAAEPTHTASAQRHGPTLDDLVAGAWEGLLAGASADCLVCGAPMVARHSAGAGIVGGRCEGCSVTIS